MPTPQHNEFPFAPLLPVACAINQRSRQWQAIMATLDAKGEPQLLWHDSLQDAPRVTRFLNWGAIEAEGNALLDLFFNCGSPIFDDRVLARKHWSCRDLAKVFARCHEMASRVPYIEVIRLSRESDNAMEITSFRRLRAQKSLMLMKHTYQPSPGRQLVERDVIHRRSIAGLLARKMLTQANGDGQSCIPAREAHDIFSALPPLEGAQLLVVRGKGALAF